MSGPAPLLAPIVKAHQFLVFTVSSSLQRAVAHGLDNEGDFYRYGGNFFSRYGGDFYWCGGEGTAGPRQGLLFMLKAEFYLILCQSLPRFQDAGRWAREEATAARAPPAGTGVQDHANLWGLLHSR